MEAPQERDLVHPAVAPVEADFADDKSDDDAQPQRPGGDRCLNTPRHRLVGGGGDERQRHRQQQRRNQAADKEIPDVLRHALLEKSAAMHRKNPLERQKDEQEQDQPGGLPGCAQKPLMQVRKRVQRRIPFNGDARARYMPGPRRTLRKAIAQAVRLRFDRHHRVPKPISPAPSSVSEAGSGTLRPLGELTPARNAIGGRLAVVPLFPQARKLNTWSAASAVRSMLT